ncbi:queuosine 5'-phosphate N-glycosylase/hydrolase-like [Artemia franciscana]|uniref:queuosine 5'-phosphate N-glycosylase/hydrolase-like n=1 Tax=Artemia franciscana TaxID=6661 RepID=UPI0032DB4E76
MKRCSKLLAICLGSGKENILRRFKRLMKLLPKQAGEFVAKNAKNVKVLTPGIINICNKIKDSLSDGSFRPDALYLHQYPHPSEPTEEAVEWLFVADLLNFSFWMPDGSHYTVTHNGVKYTGYLALTAALTRAVESGIPITSAYYYSQIDRKVLMRILEADDHCPPIPLFEERYSSLVSAGKTLMEKFGGKFSNILKEADNSALKLCDLVISHFLTFEDEALYKEQRVCIWKRVQILTADIWGLFHGKGLGYFKDIDEITMFADYRVPQVLMYFGCMEYSQELRSKLEEGQELPNGSEDEVEIRGCSIHAIELVKEELRRSGILLNSATIDFFLWDYRRKFAEELKKIPFHRTRCIYY